MKYSQPIHSLVLCSICVGSLMLQSVVLGQPTEPSRTTPPEANQGKVAPRSTPSGKVAPTPSGKVAPTPSGKVASGQAKATPKKLSPEMIAALNKGRDAYKQQKYAEATEHFLAATKIDAKNPVARYLAATSLIREKKNAAAWSQIHVAAHYAVSAKQVASIFDGFWGIFRKRGLFNSGVEAKRTLSLLGKPDRMLKSSKSTRVVYGYRAVEIVGDRVFAELDLRGLNIPKWRAVSALKFKLNSPWQARYRGMTRTMAITEYTLGEPPQKWTQLVTTQRHVGIATKLTAKKMMEGIRKQIEKYPNAEWTIVEATDKDVIYSFKVGKGEKNEAQHEIARLVQGPRDIHRIAYARKGEEGISEADLVKWLDILKAAKLEKISSRENASANTDGENNKVTESKPATKPLDPAMKKELEAKLLATSRKVMQAQIALINLGNADGLKTFFTKRLQDAITKEAVVAAQSEVKKYTVEELVYSLTISEFDGKQIAKIKMKNGRTLTTLVKNNGRWEADTLWFR